MVTTTKPAMAAATATNLVVIPSQPNALRPMNLVGAGLLISATFMLAATPATPQP